MSYTSKKQNSDYWAYDIAKNVVSKGEVKNVEVINQSIEQILGTLYGERIFNLSFGSDLSLKLFEVVSKNKGERLLNDIVVAIEKWENRIRIIESQMKLIIDSDNNSIYISIPYIVRKESIKGIFSKKIIL
jgi:phage baseplate assembly protein W